MQFLNYIQERMLKIKFMLNNMLLFIGIVCLCIGVKLVYDARLIVKKYFSSNKENFSTLMLKIFGTFMAFFGVILAIKYL